MTRDDQSLKYSAKNNTVMFKFISIVLFLSDL